ncbi:MAG: DUF3995 domain-containing protein [Chloroflexi bacterium]|nr:DUF3995 domain-containing protein [Chloroflexota bacterium]
MRSSYVACAWTLLFAAPHVWWALGVSAGFPGGDTAYRAAMSSAWFIRYNLFVVFLCAVGVLVVLALVTPLGRAVPRRVLLTLAWLGAALLTARGVAGLVADGSSDLVWWPAFMLGGVLYGMVAWRHQHGSRVDVDFARHGATIPCHGDFP